MDACRRRGRDADGAIISTEVPALLAGVRVDRGVAMVADVSRAAAAELIEAGRVLVDGAAVTVGRTLLTRGRRLTVAPAGGRRRPGVAPEPGVRFEVVHADDAGGGRGQAGRAGRPPGCGPRRRHPGRGPAGPLPRPGGLVDRECAHPTGPASCTGSTRAPRGCWRWPARQRPTGPSSSSWPPDHGAPLPGPGRRRRGRRPRRGRGPHRPLVPHARPKWRSPPPGSRPAPATPSWSAGAVRAAPTTLLELSLQSGRNAYTNVPI